MTRAFSLVCLVLIFSGKLFGQCTNAPVVTLSSTSGNSCGTATFTLSENTFGGSATRVTITENGGGSVSPGSSTSSPFSFTYTPKASDIGKKIIITVTTNNPLGLPCSAAKATYTLSINAIPAAPVVGTITKPTCTVSTGSVPLSGLPSTGTWTLTRSPGDITQTGSGTSVNITGLPAGTYSYKVTSAAGCSSVSSANIVIPAQPASPAMPVQTTDCSAGAGKAVVRVTSPTGTGLTYRIDGGTYQSGTSFSNVADGNHIITVRNSEGCTTAGSSFQVACACTNPTAPVVGLITQPTCILATGSVVLNGLPSAGTWTLTRSPGGVITTGTGTTITISGLAAGTYTYTVANSGGCVSPPSANIVINTPSSVPAIPVIGAITSPTCAVATGSVQISGLPQTGTWTLTRYPGTIVTQGNGQAVTLSGIPPGLYNYTVTNERGCISGLTANVLIPAGTNAPSAPIVGTITQPTPNIPTGSVILNNLPATGSWTLIQTPGNVSIPGSGSSVTISGLQPGVYNYTVTNSVSCISGLSEAVTISPVTAKPVVVITFPAPVCFPATVDLTDPKITAGSTPNLLFTYWTDASATGQLTTPKTAGAGTWYIKGSIPDGTYDIKPVMVTIYHAPVAKAGPDQVLASQTTTAQLEADPINDYETGLWSIITGSGTIFDPGNPKTSVDALSEEKNIFVWQITNGVCQASFDTVVITLRSRTIPTLITPNMDGRNDYLVIKSINSSERIELIVFDRTGVQLFKSDNYDNQWNGIDMFGKPLVDDTYFYVLKTSNNSQSGYLVIKR